MKQVVLFWTVLCVYTLTASATVSAKIVESIVARVNDDVITLSELNSESAGLWFDLQKSFSGKRLEEEFQKKKANILESLIHAKLLYQRGKELGFCSNVEPEVSAYIQNLMKEHKIQSMEEFTKILNNQGSSPESFRDNISKTICTNRLVGQFVQSKITINTEELNAYYKAHIQEFTVPEEIDLSEIIFYTEEGKAKEIEDQALDVLQQIKKGADFSEMAKKYSRGPTASTGGTIGNFKRGTMDPDVEKVAFALKEGQVSDSLIKTKYGFQILKVIKRKEATVTPLNEVKPKIQEAIYMRKFQPELDNFVKKLREESYIKIYPEADKEKNN